MCNEHIRSSGQERPRPPSSPFGTGPRYRREEDHIPPHVPPRTRPRRSREGGTRPGGSTHVPTRPPPPGGGWSRPTDDVGRGGPSRARARSRRRRSRSGAETGGRWEDPTRAPTPGMQSGEGRAARRGEHQRRRRALAERSGDGPAGGPAPEGQPIFVPKGQRAHSTESFKKTQLAPSAALNAESPATWRGMARLPPSEGGPAGCRQAIRAVTARASRPTWRAGPA